jgi:TolB-like protein
LRINNKSVKVTILVTLLLSFSVFTANTGTCNTGKKVAIFPFAVNSPQDLSFLQNGLYSMLSSRLADPGKVDVLEKEATLETLKEAQKLPATKGDLTESKARIIGANINVDYVLFGSLTHFGDSISLDANMVDVAGEKPTISFFKQSNNLGDIIPLVNTFSGDINQKVFSRSIRDEMYARPQQQTTPGPFQNADGSQGQYSGGPFINMNQRQSKGFITNLMLPDFVTSLATGDVDKDGKIEVVLATENTLQIFRTEDNQLVLEKKLEYDSNLRIARLDIADINGNGYPEIFVTCFSIHRDDLASFVVEYIGSQYSIIVDDETIYYGLIDDKLSDKKRLLGQSLGRHPFDGRVYNMVWDNDRYKKEKKIRMPRFLSILSLLKGNILTDEKSEFAAINQHGRLVVFTEASTIEWEGNEKYGGSAHHFLLPRDDTDGSYRDRIYLQPRVLSYDFDNKDKKELVVINNQELGGGSFGQFKRFTKGNIEVLSWNDIALAPMFQTRTVQGWISDVAISDFDNDGKMEIIAAVVDRNKFSLMSKRKKSNIISYELE